MPDLSRARVSAVVAWVVVWAALVLPADPHGLTLVDLLRVPVEGMLLVGILLTLPARWARLTAVAAGVVLATLTLVKAVDIGFEQTLGRQFNPATDGSYAGSAVGLIRDSTGGVWAVLAVVAAVLVTAVVTFGLVASTRRVARSLTAHRRTALRTVALVAAACVATTLLGIRTGPTHVADSTIEAARIHVEQVRGGIQDKKQFTLLVGNDPVAWTPSDQLLRGLAGKDVLLVFVESYGRVAVDATTPTGPQVAPRIAPTLDAGTERLRRAGFTSRSGYLTSSTFGGLSWLAHSTTQSGVWVDNQRRYNQLISGSRSTLSSTFRRAGWHTVCNDPANKRDWAPARTFYQCQQVYDARNVGYRGPTFGYPPVPDQFTLAAFARNELQPGHQPVMAEVDLVTSHGPWTPQPPLLPWSQLGDGTAYGRSAADAELVGRSLAQIRADYAGTIAYSWESLVQFVEHNRDDDLVLVVLGDHQPSTLVTGANPSRDVPISVIARDPAVTQRLAAWGWQPGLRPTPDAPVARMDTFRQRFLDTFAAP